MWSEIQDEFTSPRWHLEICVGWYIVHISSHSVLVDDSEWQARASREESPLKTWGMIAAAKPSDAGQHFRSTEH